MTKAMRLPAKETAEMTVWTVIIKINFEQCYIFVMFT